MEYNIDIEELDYDSPKRVYVYKAKVSVYHTDEVGDKQETFVFSIMAGDDRVRELLPPGGYTKREGPLIVMRNIFQAKLEKALSAAIAKGPHGTFDTMTPLIQKLPSNR